MMIRRATVEDAAAIARVHVDSWRTTYADIIPSVFLEKLHYTEREQLWQQNLLREDNTVFVAENEAGCVVGFADTSRRAQNRACSATDLTSLYVWQHYHGNGIGKQLMTALFEFYKEQGYETIYVDVLADNHTRYFYEYLGAIPFTTTTITIGGKALAEITYVWQSVDAVLHKLKR